MTMTADYAHRIMWRSREPMEPQEYQVDWDDAPLRHKIYPDVRRVALPPDDDDTELGAVARLIRRSYAMTGRRTRVAPQTDIDHQQDVSGITMSRGTASGGGMYPVELYLVLADVDGYVPGVYHYSSAHDALDLLLVGDFRDRVAASVHDERLPRVYVLASVMFWKNAFKYNSFAYHVVSTDIGTLFATWSAHSDAAVNVRLWFDEDDLDDLLGLEGRTESVFAVVTVGEPRGRGAAPPAPSARARVRRGHYEKSVRTEEFDDVVSVQAEIQADRRPAPDGGAFHALGTAVSSGRPIELAAPAEYVITPALDRTRRSSFGLFDSSSPLSQAELTAVLRAASSDAVVCLPGEGLVPDLIGISVFVSHVEGVETGAYDVSGGGRMLYPIPGDALHPFLQYNYYLSNYNLEQAAAVIAVRARPVAVVEEVGPRGLRLVNAEVGGAAQRIYMAAAALGFGCGAVLGFDNVSIQERLGRAGTDDWPLLLVMIGRERAARAEYHYEMLDREEWGC